MEGVAAAWSSWSCADVGRWLSDQGFQEHVELFANNKISGSILPELTRNALRDDLGIAAFGDRVRIAQAIEALIASSSPSSLPASGDASASSATSTTSTSNAQPQAWLPRDENALDLVVLHAAPLVIKDSRHRIYPMEKLDLEAERREISNSLLTDVQHKAIHVRFDIATADILRSLMTAWKCTVLHFSGHGLGQRAALCFEDGAGCTHLITPDALRQLMFSGHPPGERQVPGVARDAAAGPKPLDGNVKLVFVNACHSQKVASVFLNAGIPHVVAVHSDSLVVDASATMFAKHFYLSLFHGHTVSTAFEIAKGAVRALPTQKRAACCCAHLHEPTCTWMRDGSRHSQHSATQCCCKGHVLAFPHDESSKFLLLGSAPHDVVLFGDIPNGSLRDYTPRYPSNIPSMHGQFIGRNTETYLMVKSLRENAVTACLGAPGIGKSSLIISVAHFVHSRRMFPDGVFYVDLEGQKLSTVRYAIAQSIGMPAADTDEEVFAELGTKNCLLVLDKVEELLDEDENKGEELLHQLISVAPNLKLLLASRRNMHIPSVTPYSLSISELPLHTATELLCLVAPGCSAKLAERLARICGCLPLAIRVVGRALANARMTVTPERMIEYLERDEHRFETIRELNQVGHKECVDRCIRSSFCHLDEPLRLAFMALGFFRGSFEIEAAEAVLSSMLTEQNAAGKLVGSSSYSLMSSALSGSVGATTSTSSSSNATYFPADAYAKSNRSRSRDDDVSSVRSLGSQLSNMDGFGFDNDGAMTNDSYDLLDLESSEEVKAREVSVPSASVALELLHQWSLVEFDTKTNRYRMHNLVQLFAEEEAGRMGEECFADRGPASMSGSVSSSFVAASMGAPTMSISLGKELLLTWKRRFVRYYCMIVAKASHAYRFEGTLALFDKERANIESAMRLAHELTLQSIEQVRESNCRVQQEIVSDQIGEVPTSSTSTMRSKSEPAFFTGDGALPTPTIESHRSSSAISTSNSSSSGGVGSGQRSAGSAGLSNSTIVDALLYSNLVVRCRFIFRARVEPRRRIQVVSSCLQLSRETRSLHCTCGNRENDPATLLWDVEEAKFDRELSLLDKLPSFEEPQPPVASAAAHDRCTCVGIRELIALEALLLTDLGYACCDVTDWVAGEYHYLESLRLQREVLGWSEHPQVAEVLNQFGICLSTRWGYLAHNVWLLQHAERLLKGSLEMRSRVLSKNHPEYATSLNNLANFYKNYPTAGKRRSPSAALRDESRDSRERHSRGGKSGGRRGGSTQRGARSKSSPSPSRSSTSSESMTSPSQKDAKTIKGATDASGEQEPPPDIAGMYRQSLKIREITLGENHPQVAQSLNNLALYLSNQLETQNLSEAELATQRAEIGRLYERALRIRRSRLGNASFETAATLNNMGNFKRLTKDWHGAEENIKEALQITDRYFNDISPRAARIFINLARVYRDQKRYGEAIAAYKKAQDIRQQLFPDTRDVGFCIEQIGKCLRLQGKEEEGKVLEERGRQMKKLGLSALEQDELGEVDSGSTISGGSNGFQHAILSGDNVEGGISSSHLFARVNVYDIVDAEALISRKFNFPGKLLGERGIHLKKIEAIACAQLRYFGPWPQSLTKWSKGSQRGGSSCTMPEAYIQITSTNEAALERAKEQSVQLLREMKLSWERITAEVVAGGVAAEEADICICIGLHRPSYRDQIALVAPLMLTYGDARHEEVG
ncbi:hypothetical protein PF005_g2119 [Phytophthora fragariae]|uniref:SAM domain-containing protein n=1 Tax=Phytophthora fragariae TaxID=53985 RepID=A0A6A3ZBY2_9STRA|nr:hypothetical protein PF009_g2429 [Phytophthora fragariae]KAE9233955.1 hypothetical protein PF005_g2119 [Phytophthora fragariae]KAE9255280.1 hypothetical protein PF002_g2436 [Phytophthora fragariae]KAE9327413.1 hypothetical protein PF001_g1946 [Phytophthora fragariae]